MTQEETVPQKPIEKTLVQWRFEAKVLANAELYAIVTKTSVREMVEDFLASLPKYVLTEQTVTEEEKVPA